MGTDAKSRAVIAMRTRHMEWDGFLSAAEAFRNSTPAFADRGIPGQLGVKAIPALAERGRAGLARYFDSLEKTLAESEYVAGDRYRSLHDRRHHGPVRGGFRGLDEDPADRFPPQRPAVVPFGLVPPQRSGVSDHYSAVRRVVHEGIQAAHRRQARPR
jgi:hypothetical protein